MVEGEEVFKRHVHAQVVDVSLLHPLLREGVAEVDVLHTQVSHVEQILALSLHGEACVAAAEVPSTGIVGVGVVFCPVVLTEGLRHGAFLGVPAGDGELTGTPDLALADALAVDREVKALVVGTQTEAILVARCRVADNLQVAVVAVGVVAVVDVAVAVEVNKLDVAGRADELVVVLEGH